MIFHLRKFEILSDQNLYLKLLEGTDAIFFFLNMLTVVILAWSSSKISYQSNVWGKCHGKAKFMKGWRSYYGELLWRLLESTGAALGPLHQHPTRIDVACSVWCHWLHVHAMPFFFSFFSCWFTPICAERGWFVLILVGMADTAQFWPKRTPKWAATMSLVSILLLHMALWESEK